MKKYILEALICFTVTLAGAAIWLAVYALIHKPTVEFDGPAESILVMVIFCSAALGGVLGLKYAGRQGAHFLVALMVCILAIVISSGVVGYGFSSYAVRHYGTSPLEDCYKNAPSDVGDAGSYVCVSD